MMIIKITNSFKMAVKLEIKVTSAGKS